MRDRVFELLRTLEDRDLEAGLRDAASQSGLSTLDDEDLRHLVRVLTSTALVVTSLADLIKLAEVLDAQEPNFLRVLEGDPDEDQLHRLLAVPDHVRMLGDKCLFEAGVARRRGPKGLDLEEIGRRSYCRASRILSALGEDRRLGCFYDQNAINRASLEHDVQFLSHCSDMFSTHVRLLHEMLHSGAHSAPLASTALVPARVTPAASSSARVVAPADAKDSAAVATRPVPIRPAAAAPDDDAGDDSDGPRRIMDLHIVGRSDEEAAAERVRDLLAAEKTVLFSMLEPELLRTELKKVVIRQEGAIDSLCDEICLYATGTQDPRKPASYFLVGPTGVGKNYLVESLLRLFERLWGIEVPYLELEGPEFTYPSDINELKGAARGFIRSDEEGVMTKFHERSHDKPFAVILIDEIEKAHPQLRRFFLPIMDRGTMMDNRGRMLNFVNTTIFFTSNIGYSESGRSSAHIGFGDEASESRAETAFVESRIKKTLSPEFINRVHMIHFRHLTREAVDDILDLEMGKIRKRYRQAQGLELRVTAAARAEFLARGYSHEYGARNLAKVLNRWANIEISKVIKRDEDRSDADATPTLELIRAMREGKRPLDMEHVRRAVQDATRMRLPYRSVTIDVEGGEFTYQRG